MISFSYHVTIERKQVHKHTNYGVTNIMESYTSVRHSSFLQQSVPEPLLDAGITSVSGTIHESGCLGHLVSANDSGLRKI